MKIVFNKEKSITHRDVNTVEVLCQVDYIAIF